MGGSENSGTPKWMENPIRTDDLGVPLFSETPYVHSDFLWGASLLRRTVTRWWLSHPIETYESKWVHFLKNKGEHQIV